MTKLLDEYGKRAPWQTVGFTAKQKDELEVSMTYLVINCPFFADVMYRKLPIVFVSSKDCPIAATDHYSIAINPETFFAYPMKKRVFILAHEILHHTYCDCLVMHKWRASGFVWISPSVKLPYNDDMMARADDYRINAMLIASKVGEFDPDWLYDESLSAQGFETNVEVYVKLHKREQQGQQMRAPQRSNGIPQPGGTRGPKAGPSTPGGQFDKLVSPGEIKGGDADKLVEEASEQEHAVSLAGAAAAADAQGLLPAGLKRVIMGLIDPVKDWHDVIRSTLYRRTHGEGYNWEAPDRRLITRDRVPPRNAYTPVYFAQPSDFGCGHIVIGCDTSGSVFTMTEKFLSEMEGIVAQMKPSQITVLWCDAKVHRVDELDEPEDMSELKAAVNKDGGPGGGGGTSFVPVFADIEKLGIEPEVLVYFTDMEGAFPNKAPDYPVIWASIKKNKSAPFGDLVDVSL